MKKFYFSLLSVILISFSLCIKEKEIDIITIDFKNENITINNLSNYETYFHLTISPNINSLPNYIKISVADETILLYINKFFIFYYQEDSTFTSIKQISRTEQQLPTIDYPYIWLNKEQIKKGIYFKIRDDSQQGPYKVIITPSDYCKLDLYTQTYTYLTTKENQEMSFIINIDDEYVKKDPVYDDNKIIIWIDSQKDITYELNIKDYIKHSKYNTFILEHKEQEKYIIKINANIGDTINLGFMYIIKKGYYMVNKNRNSRIGLLYKGFLKAGVLEEICFDDDVSIYFKFMDDININILNIQYQIFNYKCLTLRDSLNELYFNAHYLWYSGYPIAVNSPNYYSLLTGINYHISIPSKVSLGYLPLTLENDFNYLTYHVVGNINRNIEYKIYIADCNDYPSCNIDKKILTNIVELKHYFNSYTYIFNKTQLNNDYISPTSSKRKILIFDCIKGSDSFSDCNFDVNIYTDKTKKLIHALYIPFHKYIKANTKDNLLVSLIDLHDMIYGYRFPVINIDILTGNITIKADKELNAKYNNSYIYKLNSIYEALDLKIEAKKDSIYSIKYYYIINETNYYYAPVGENYLFNIDKGKNGVLYFIYHTNFNVIFTKIQPINSEITGLDIKEYKAPDSNGSIFYQDFTFNVPEYPISPCNLENPLIIYAMSYGYDSPILLKDNFEENFAFNEENIELNYVYYVSDLYKNLNIDINLLNEGNFNLTLYLNDILIVNLLNLSSSKIIEINFDKLKNISLSQQVNKISINLKTLNNINESFVKIKINQINKNIVEYQANNGNKKRKFIIIILFICLVVILLGIILLKKIKKRIKKNRNINLGEELKEIEEDYLKIKKY